MEKDESIKVDCKEITPEGELICNIGMKDAAEMLRRGIEPVRTKLNVKDKVLDSSQSTDGVQATEENKSTEGTQATEENKSTAGIKPTEADSSSNHGCGCSKTTDYSEIAKFVAKYLQKNEEN